MSLKSELVIYQTAEQLSIVVKKYAKQKTFLWNLKVQKIDRRTIDLSKLIEIILLHIGQSITKGQSRAWKAIKALAVVTCIKMIVSKKSLILQIELPLKLNEVI